MGERFSAFDVADDLDGEETIAEYLSAVLAQGDTDLLIAAIGDVAKARGMSQIAEGAGLGRESLYKALAPGAKPRFETIVKVLGALGVRLELTAATGAEKRGRAPRARTRTSRSKSEARL